MIGKQINQYKILEKLGEGGMGVVYKAQDTKLDRTVALKFLPAHLTASDTEKARFLQEAKAAAQLNHPNVCVIHEIQDQGEHPFIVMEYVEGQTIHKMVSTGDKLAIDKVVEYAIQMADALQTAHEKDIVHRDIKSDNIMVTAKNRIKVMDFGLAKLKGTARLTKSASTVGTLAYMAPEQIQGHDVDSRSDIFSFGVVLFEMLTGKLPFKGDYEAALMYEIMNERPQSAESLRPDIPSELTHIINRALEKDPNDRYQSISDLLIDLRRLKRDSTKVSRPAMPAAESSKEQPAPTTEVAPAKQKHKLRLPLIVAGASLIIILVILGIFLFPGGEVTSQERLPIAVADFINQTNEPELNGLSGMLITALEQSRRLAVVTRSRMFDILDQMGKKDVNRIDESLGRQICQQANIGAMVVASIRKFGKLYTIDLKVVDPNKNEYLFTAKEEAEGQESIPTMLDKLSEKTRVGLKERVTQVKETSQKVASVTTTNLEAYQHYFQGQQFINQLKFKEATEEFKKAIVLDSTFGSAYYRLAYAESWGIQGEGVQKGHIKSALKYINRLPERERFLVRAENARIENGFKAGIAIYREMEKIYPDDKEMIYNIGDWSYHIEDYTTAISYLSKTLETDPNNYRALQHLTWTYRDMGSYDKMLETAKRYVSVAGSGESYNLLGNAYALLDQFEQGLTTLRQARGLFPENYHITGSIARIYAYQGKFDEAAAELSKLIEQNQPAKAKLYGYHQLSSFYPYQGKYRKSINFFDKIVKLHLQENDTSRAMNDQLSEALFLVWGWNDRDKARKEIEKTIPFKGKTLYHRIVLNYLQIYNEDYTAAADRLAELRQTSWWRRSAQSIIYSLKRDEKNAEIFADSVLQNNNDDAKILVLYPLAECQYEKGQLKKALESIKTLQTIKVWGFSRSVHYPKSFYLMGKIYEKTGDVSLAIKNYEKFLELWKNADQDLPELIDAKERLAKLRGVS
jgi:serine/threonine protein kinase/tetratricopeptide (TPR) repeat protein